MADQRVTVFRDGVEIGRGTIKYAGSHHAWLRFPDFLIPRMDDDWERGRRDAATNDAIDAVCAAGGARCEIFGFVFSWEAT
jgi:hypothetical protein